MKTIHVKVENDSEQENAEIENSEQTEQESEEIENSEQTKQESAENENSEQIQRTKKKNGRIDTTKKDPTTKVVKKKPKLANVPELEKIAENATSFEHFVKLVVEWLNLNKRQDFFENLAIASAEVDKISWKELETRLKSKGVTYADWDKIYVSKQISERLKEYSVTILPFLNAIRQYKEYSFGKVETHSEEEISTEQATEEIPQDVEEKAEDSNGNITPKPRVKMECMPEIRKFEETLASVDKTQPVEDRVRYVLNAMGLKQMSVQEQKQIVEIASTALRKEKIDFDVIFVEANIPMDKILEARMIFSKFVNDFVQKYERDKKVQLLIFLSELQSIIMLKDEIERFLNFTD